MSSSERNLVFISYSHKDSKYLEEFKTHLTAVRDKLVIWDDTAIQPGDDWQAKIKRALQKSRIAVLLVSPDFLASHYIETEELPYILNHSGRYLRIFWIPIHASLYEYTAINNYQAAYDPAKPIGELPRPSARHKAWVKITEKLLSAYHAPVEGCPEQASADYPIFVSDEEELVYLYLGGKIESYSFFLTEPPIVLDKSALENFKSLEARRYPRYRDAHMALLSFLSLVDYETKDLSMRNQHLVHAHSVLQLLGTKLDQFKLSVEKLEQSCDLISQDFFAPLKAISEYHQLLFEELERVNILLEKSEGEPSTKMICRITQISLLLERICHWLLQSHRMAHTILYPDLVD